MIGIMITTKVIVLDYAWCWKNGGSATKWYLYLLRGSIDVLVRVYLLLSATRLVCSSSARVKHSCQALTQFQSGDKEKRLNAYLLTLTIVLFRICTIIAVSQFMQLEVI